jgi:hypothetical protein
MQAIEDQIQSLVNQPSEKLNVELKPWTDLSSKKGQSVIAKASLALRNQNGGFLLIGFDDNGSPLPLENGLDVRAAFRDRSRTFERKSKKSGGSSPGSVPKKNAQVV